MSKIKKWLMAAILSLIVIIGIFTIVSDLSWFVPQNKSTVFYSNELMKRITVLLAAALIWLAGRDALDQRDNKLMKLIFIIIVIGEAFFLLGKPFGAILAFMLCQLLLIIRHTKGLSNKLSKAPLPKTIVLFFLAVVLLLLPRVAITLLPISKLTLPLLIIGTLYGIILGASLWAGIASFSLGLFPRRNSIMIAVGMLCFYVCDLLVGLDGLQLQEAAGIPISAIIWFFYVPAIALLALSSYNYVGIRRSSALNHDLRA